MIRYINNKKTTTQGFDHLYPFESRFININGHKLHYLDKGRGKPVIMVHGNPTWSFYFRHLVKVLSGSCRTLVPDHIGCGLSDKPSIHRYGYTLKNRVRDLETFIESLKLKEKVTLILHDWGGMIGLAWALDHLDKIDKIIITNTSGFLLPDNRRLPFRLWLIKYLTPLSRPAVLGLNLFSISALFMAPAKPLSRAVKKGLTAPYNSWKNRIATLKFVQDIPITPDDPSYDLVRHVDENLSKLATFPMMILWGEKDFVFNAGFLAQWKKRFPNARLTAYKDAGHYLFEDKPEETSDLIKTFINN